MSNSGAHQEDGDKNQDRELHFTFVELLFSLAVAEIAQRFAGVIDKADGDFLETKYWPCYSHLFLALIVITTSWIGWGKSNASHRNSKFASVFRLDFVELLIDVVLVIVYFVLVHRSEDVVIDAITKASTVTPSIVPEGVCVAMIFTLYFAWDVVSKWPSRIDDFGNQNGWEKLKDRGKISLIVMVIAIATAVIGWIVRRESLLQTITFDFSLVCLVVLFRELKQAATDAPTEFWGWRKDWQIWFPALLFILFLLISMIR